MTKQWVCIATAYCSMGCEIRQWRFNGNENTMGEWMQTIRNQAGEVYTHPVVRIVFDIAIPEPEPKLWVLRNKYSLRVCPATEQPVPLEQAAIEYAKLAIKSVWEFVHVQ